MSPSFHQLAAQRAFPSNPPALLFQISSEKSISTRPCEHPNPPLVCLPQPVCLFSLAVINNWDPRCNEMVMLVRTIPRPAPAFRPPALNGDNNFSSRRGGDAYWPYMQSATCQNRNIRSAHTSSASHWSSWNG